MQRYSRDREREGEGGSSERGSQARADDRFSQGQYRDPRSEFGSRHEPEYSRAGGRETSTHGSYPASGRSREFGGDRSYGRGEPYSGGAPYGGRDEEDDRGEWRRDPGQHGGRTAWQPGRHAVIDPRRWQSGETEYGVYGPRYASQGYGSSFGNHGERFDDRYGRQGYGQGTWQQEHEQEQHRFDPDYLQWRSDQIRELDNDYQRYRQERYQKFCEDFGSWRKNRQASTTPTGSQSAHSGNESGASTAHESSSSDPMAPARDSLGNTRGNK